MFLNNQYIDYSGIPKLTPIICVEDVPIYSYVNLFYDSGNLRVRLADSSLGYLADGFALNTGYVNTGIRIQSIDRNENLSGLIVGNDYYLGTLGQVSLIPSIQRLGKAITDKILFFSANENIFQTNRYECGDSVGGNRVVMIDNNLLFHFEPIEANYGKAIGISVQSGNIGDMIDIQTEANLDGFGYLYINDIYYADANGLITNVSPASGVSLQVGVASSSSILNVGLKNEFITI